MTGVDTPAPAGAVPGVAEVRRRLRRLRRPYRQGRLADRASDLYIVVLALGFAVATVASSTSKLTRSGWLVADPSRAATTILLVCGVVVAGGLATLLLRAVGPLYAGAPTQTWLLATPGDRGRWLRRRFGWLLAAASALGALAGLAVAAAAHRVARASAVPAWILAGAALIGAATAAALVIAAVTRQAGRHRDPGPATPTGDAAGRRRVVATPEDGGAAGLLGRLDRAALTGGAALAGSAIAAGVSVDPAMLFQFVEARRMRRLGRVRARRLGAWGPRSALLIAEARRLSRHRPPLLVFAALILAAYAAGIVLGPVPVTLLRVLAGYLAVNGLAGGLRAVCRSPALRRMVGHGDDWLRGTHLVAPGLGAVIWVATTMGAGRHLGVPGSLVLVAGLIGAVYRTATRPPMNYDVAWAATPMGIVPIGLITQVVRGPDVAVVLAVVCAYLL